MMDSSKLHQALSLHAHARLPPSSSLPLRTASSTPMSSPGLFSPSPSHFHQPTSLSESNTPAPALGSPYLHPLQNHRVRETHKALIDSDIITGRKSINQYEVIEEIGRGMHGKVKLARNTQTAENVAIKIIPRFSKKRRLGRVTAMSPQDKTKKEIAILKKIRHPNVVALLEVIDDPELEKIYMVLEHVELGEVVWRKKGLPHICQYERRRIEREMRGDAPTAEEEQYNQILERRQALKELKRARLAQNYAGPTDYWSVEYGAADERSSAGPWSRIPSREDFAVVDGQLSPAGSCRSSRAPSRSLSSISAGPVPPELDEMVDWSADMETPLPPCGSYTALDGATHGSHCTEGSRPRSSSIADSIISHMSSVDYNPRAHDPFAEDFSFVPCFTMDQAHSTFRDTVLGLEYLHYQGVVHRDIKPANLLWTRDHRVKISDFGVSYFGRPIRDGELDETVSESEAKDFDDDLELAKTVGTPAFFAPELCYTDVDRREHEQPKVSEQIDVWSLGVTLYCLIYARIPFLGEDEFQMFKKIATDDVHISRRRLKPVDPSTSPSATSLFKRQNAHPYRDDNDLEYEEVDNLLYDLLRQMLIKNPEKRIRLRDIKRHPWVVQGITNPVGWLDETDPARPSCGSKIQVDEKEMSFAVVPLTFLERARSVVKKAVGKVMHPLVERGDSRSRRRAASSVASSAGDSMFRHSGPPTNYTNDRGGSFRVDDYFFQGSRDGASPVGRLAPSSSGTNLRAETLDNAEEDSPCRKSQLFQLRPPSEARPSPATLWCGGQREGRRDEEPAARRARRAEPKSEDSARSASADRALFVSTDKRAHAQVAQPPACAGDSCVDMPCPSSPGAEEWTRHFVSPSRGNTMTTMKSSSVESMEAIGTPLTSPSETTSPVPRDMAPKSASHKMLVFQSDPSLPALLSGASSVSADMEGELLGRPGIVKGQSPRLGAGDCMTRPVPAKESCTSFRLDHVFENPPAMESGALALHLVPVGPGSPGTVGSSDGSPSHDDDDDASDDGILLMAKPRKRSSLMFRAPPVRPVEAKRRDTGASTASTDTAKRVPVHDDDDGLWP
ncbi:hypothetical protein G6O67_007821 [Ophiocordyceps sinensis]|uniref:non-specific serine/threonine protein kinase n=1 Tax=Ophiocordyceps sinensis TaxID=72228 RepID=A0A8H4LUM5_9HYPO|nr:hypothetical protein G6O67_007821 [Ophiocordyceps sinensis]